MTTRSLSEIVSHACSLRSPEQKVEWLRLNDSQALRSLLAIVYDPKNHVWNIPNDSPPLYTKSNITESHGLLYRNVRKLRYLIRGFDGDRLPQYRREYLLKEILESIDAKDAELMEQVLMQKPFKGLTKKVVQDAFPTLVP